MIDLQKLRATGRINVTSFEATPYDDAATFTISEVNIVEEFSGDLVGVGSMRLMMATESGGGATYFAGMERFLGKVRERSGSFILRNSGTLKEGVLDSRWLVIPGSGSEELAGLRGE